MNEELSRGIMNERSIVWDHRMVISGLICLRAVGGGVYIWVAIPTRTSFRQKSRLGYLKWPYMRIFGVDSR